MSADSAVTYTSVHSEARSWSIPSEDPYEEAARQLLEQAPRSPEYVPDPMSRAAMRQMRAAAPSTYHSLLPSGTPPLLPIPLPTPSTSRRADIPEADTPPRKRLLLTTPRPECESSVAAAVRQPGPTIETRSDDTEEAEFCTRHHDAQKDRADVRAEIEGEDIEGEALEARVTVVETEARRHEWQRQATDDLAVRFHAYPGPGVVHALTDWRITGSMYLDFGYACITMQSVKVLGLLKLAGGLRRNGRLDQCLRGRKTGSYRLSNCTVGESRKFATCLLLWECSKLWWNSHARTVPNDVGMTMTWTDLKKIDVPGSGLTKLKICWWDRRPDITQCCASKQRPCRRLLRLALDETLSTTKNVTFIRSTSRVECLLEDRPKVSYPPLEGSSSRHLEDCLQKSRYGHFDFQNKQEPREHLKLYWSCEERGVVCKISKCDILVPRIRHMSLLIGFEQELMARKPENIKSVVVGVIDDENAKKYPDGNLERKSWNLVRMNLTYASLAGVVNGWVKHLPLDEFYTLTVIMPALKAAPSFEDFSVENVVHMFVGEVGDVYLHRSEIVQEDD
ncbi:hypothetical protein Tco_0053445 [Tanacetum coccineum]